MAILIPQQIRSCDFTNQRFDTPVDGFAVIARGATGRWCVVMEGCEAAMAEQGITAANLVSYADAHTIVANIDGDYADF